MRTALAVLLALWTRAPDDAPVIEVPPGFVVERVAGPPLVERPIMAAFDDRGRLYVSDSAGVNLKGAELLKDPPHRIRLLEDSDGDGVFDTSSVWADKLVFPQGLLWHEGAVYVVSPPGLWRLEDSDGDGSCDRRTELVTGFANTGVADDAHGCCLGPDGRLYFLPGRMAHDLKRPDGTPIRKAVGPWVMRCRFDGSDVEIVAGSLGNPVEIDFLPEGDAFVSGTFWAPNAYGGGLRDALIHAVEGGEYAVRDRTYADRKRTGDFLPVLLPMPATAPSGMMIYRSGAFGRETEGDLFCSYFNTHKVQRHVLARDGATFRARTEEFVSSSHADFHPTDVLEDADGSVLVVDTGGWFRIGCPTSQIAKPQVLGGIYRVRRRDAPRVDDPRGLKIDWDKAGVELLDDPRFAVRERAIREIARRGSLELPGNGSRRRRLNEVWTLARMGRHLSQAYLRDEDPGVRQAAANVAGLYRDAGVAERLMEMVRADAPPVRREAAAALGRIGRGAALPALFDALRAGGDRFLEHALLYAILRINDREETLPYLRDPHPAVRRGALIALDQMEGGNLTREMVTPLLDPADFALQQAAVRVIAARPGWAKEVTGLLGRWLGEGTDPESLRNVLIAFAADASVQDLAARALRREETPAETRLAVLEAMARTPLERPPATWLAEARWALDHADGRVTRQAVATLRAAGAADFDAALLASARNDARPADLRAEAAAAAAPRIAQMDRPLFDFLASCLAQDLPPLLRLTAAEAIGRARLADSELIALNLRIPHVGALELPTLLAPYERSRSAAVGKVLVAALGKSPGLAGLTRESLERALGSFPEEVRQSAEPLYRKTEAGAEEQGARLADLEKDLPGGDPARGRQVFLGPRAGCTACHAAGGFGGRVGPDLSKIGAIRGSRDLLEAVIYPSATFSRGYEPFILRTRDGQIHNGTIARETPDAIYLFTTERVEQRIARDAIEVLQPARVSVMPQGLDAQLSRGELADLVAYLLSLK